MEDYLAVVAVVVTAI